MKTISDLEGFLDICNETELYETEAGCSDGRHPIYWGPDMPEPFPLPEDPPHGPCPGPNGPSAK